MFDIGFFDCSIWVVYFVLLYLILYIYKSSKKTNPAYSLFLTGFSINIFGGLIFALVYIYYYGFGDTFLYHNYSSVLVDTFLSDTGTYFQLLWSENAALPPSLSEYQQIIPYSRTSEEWFMVKLLTPITFLGFKSYLITTLLISCISFLGSWKLFRVFDDILPEKRQLIFAIVFIMPSVFFWGSGILKDTISLAAFNLLIYVVYFAIKNKSFGFWTLIKLILLSFLIFKLKSYIIISFIPALGVILYMYFSQSIKSRVVKFVLQPMILGLFVFAIYVGISVISESSEKYGVEELEQQARGFHSWHTTTAGSAYNLGEIEYTLFGVISKIPASLNVTFFRPYLWESRNAVMLVSALESLVLLVLVVLTLIRFRLRMFRRIFGNPFITGFFIYCILFGFAIGFTSYNFGALMRYKIPISSIIYFIFIYVRTKESSQEIAKGIPADNTE